MCFEHAELGLLLGGDGILSWYQHRDLCWQFRELIYSKIIFILPAAFFSFEVFSN